MNKVLIAIIFIAFMILGFSISNFLSEDEERLTIKDIAENTNRYIGQEVTVRGKAVQHSANDWIKLEDGKYSVYVKHNMMNEYFRYGEKYQATGTVRKGEVAFEEEEQAYIDTEKDGITRNNSFGWI